MNARAPLALLLALLTTAPAAVAAPEGSEWVSYRDAYRAMVVFEKYGKPKNLLQNQFQVAPREKGVSADGLQLTLSGKSTTLNLPLDPTGRTVFPMSKASYDENAALLINRKIGQFVFRPRVSIVVQPDGVYEAAELRAACEQALNYQRYIDASLNGKSCAGVRLVYPQKGPEPGVRLRKPNGETVLLPVQDGAAFADELHQNFRVINVRPGEGQLLAPQAPLAITPLFE